MATARSVSGASDEIIQADVAVVGHGLAGLVAATEACDRGAVVALVDQQGEQDLGGQAYWSFGGLFMVDSPEQRRLGVNDSVDLALADWFGSAAFEDHDVWPKRWAEAYVDFAAGEKRAWLHQLGHRLFPVVGWAERGDGTATGHGNSVPRFHITWGTGPGVVEPFLRRARTFIERGRLRVYPRHRMTQVTTADGTVTGLVGDVLEPATNDRGAACGGSVVGAFQVHAQATILSTGGLGNNHELVRQSWPHDLGTPPSGMVAGVPGYVDGSAIPMAQAAGAHLLNPTRMWHYVEGIRNWNPVWENHGIRILPGPSSLWLDATGHRLPAPYFPGTDTRGTLRYLRSTGHDYSWFVLNQRIIEKEFALSGSEQNPDLTSRSVAQTLGRVRQGAPGPIEAFKEHGEDFIVSDSLDDLVTRMAALAGDGVLDTDRVLREVAARDAQLDNPFGKDAQLHLIRQARAFRGDKLIRVAPPHRLTDPQAGPLIAVRLHVLTRKTLGGLLTDLDSRALHASGEVIPGLWAAGEAAGFGGGGVHGHNSLEGTFLGGCLFSGRNAGRSAAAAIA